MTNESAKPGSEKEIISLFEEIFAPEKFPGDLLIGIGDDAAAVEPGSDPDTKFVFTADMLVEHVHFIPEFHSAYDIGRRCAVTNLSDIAAMGAIPRWGILTLALPEKISTDWLRDFAKGMRDVMSPEGAQIIGGDLTRSTGEIVISLTIIGETTGRLIRRKGAVLGDFIAVTGDLGASSAGLAVWKAGESVSIPKNIREKLIGRHKCPNARVRIGEICANNEGIHAMMDISDGLGIDLGRLCEASGVGARIFEQNFPISDEVREVAKILNRDVLDFVNGGEDFELLIVGNGGSIDNVSKSLEEFESEPKLTIIGEIIDPAFGLLLARSDGTVVNPSSMGWDHFKMKK
ncbi:MAG: thiamine-phosphate kinase [bacterium]